MSSEVSKISSNIPLTRKLDLRLKIIIPFCAILMLVFLLLWLLIEQQLNAAVRTQTQSLGTILAEQSAESVTELVLTNDLLSLNVILNRLVRMDSIALASIFDVDNQVIASAGEFTNETTGIIFSAPIDLQDSVAGKLELVLIDHALIQQKNRLTTIFWGMLVAGLAFITATSLALASHIRKPILDLTHMLANPEETEPPENIERLDEIGRLTNTSISLLKHYKQQRKELFGDEIYTPNKNAHSGGTQIRSVLLSLEVANFESTQAMLNPSTLSGLLDSYFQLLYRAQKLYSGKCYRFTGHTIMLGFESRDIKGSVLNAVNCAYLFQKLLNKNNLEYQKHSGPRLEFHSFIHIGEVVQVQSSRLDESASSMIGASVKEALDCLGSLTSGQIRISAPAFSLLAASGILSSATQETIVISDSDSKDVYVLPASFEDRENTLNAQCEQIFSEKTDS